MTEAVQVDAELAAMEATLRVVKVQISVVTTGAKAQALIYDELCEWHYQADVDDELLDAMGGRLKVYVMAWLDSDNMLQLEFDHELEIDQNQSW